MESEEFRESSNKYKWNDPWVREMNEMVRAHLHQASASMLRQRLQFCSHRKQEVLKNGFATHFQSTPLISMRTESQASSQSGRILDAGAWCKRALTSRYSAVFHMLIPFYSQCPTAHPHLPPPHPIGGKWPSGLFS